MAAVVKVPVSIPVTNGTLTANCTVGRTSASSAYITVTDTVGVSISISSMSLSGAGGTFTAQLQGCSLGPSGSSTDVASIWITGLPDQPSSGAPFAGALSLDTGVQLQFAGSFAPPYP